MRVRILQRMPLDDAMPGRLVKWLTAAEPDWDAVYSEQLPRVYNFFRYRIGDRRDVEDLTAQTFEKAWRARHRYRRDLSAFTTWLLTIARNVATDYYRSRRIHEPIDDENAFIASAATPEEAAVSRSNSLHLAMLMAAL